MKPPKDERTLNDRAAELIATLDIPQPVREHYFAKPRRFRLDFAWTEIKLGVEVQGAIFQAHRGHTSPRGMLSDMSKINVATQLDWSLLIFATPQIKPSDQPGSFLLIVEHEVRRRYRRQARENENDTLRRMREWAQGVKAKQAAERTT